MTLKSCSLCLQNKKLSKSHSIPNAAFKSLLKSNNGNAISIYADTDTPIQYMNDSWADQILCHDCENFLNETYEKYSISLLRGKNSGISFHGYGFTLSKTVEIWRFRLFLISILWRASISEHKSYGKVVLPNYIKDEIRNYLLTKKDIPDRLVTVCVRQIFDSETGKFSRSQLDDFITSPYYRKNKDSYSFCFVFLGIFLEIHFPGLKFKKRISQGVLKKGTSTFFAPRIDLFDIPEIVDILGAGIEKAKSGLVSPKIK